MFVLVVLEDDVKVDPQDLAKPTHEAITAVIEEAYIDKVVHDLGLVVTLYDLLEISGGSIYPGDGAAHFNVKFRLVVFRPFTGEVLVGKLAGSTRAGLRVSLGFFSDITVPEYALQDPSTFDEKEKVWVWKFNANEMYMDLEEEICFRVQSVKFNKAMPEQQNGKAAEVAGGIEATPVAHMEILGDINGDGAGSDIVVGRWRGRG